MTLLVCFLVLGLGLTSDYFFQPYAFPSYRPLAATQPSGTDVPVTSTQPAEVSSPNVPAPTGKVSAGSSGQTEPSSSEETQPIASPRLTKVTSRGTQVLARVVYAVIPNMQFFWVSDAVILRRPIPAEHVLRIFGYAVFYILALVLLAIALFQAREVAAEEAASSAPPVVHLLGVVGRVFAALQVAAGFWWSLTEAVKPDRTGLWFYPLVSAVGVALWFFWGWFARGMKWTWYLAILLVGVLPLGVMAYVLIRQPLLFSPLFAMPGIAAILVLTILGKSSRTYFGFGKERRRRPKTEPEAG